METLNILGQIDVDVALWNLALQRKALVMAGNALMIQREKTCYQQLHDELGKQEPSID
jgi:hypothetical protein